MLYARKATGVTTRANNRQTGAVAPAGAPGGTGARQSDGREARLLAHVLSSSPRGDAKAVLDTIDTYARGTEWLMNVGDVKGNILDVALARASAAGAKVFVEIGAYCGYSAVRIGRQLPPGGRLFSLEVSPANAEVARSVLDHAGLSERVTVITADVDNGIEALAAQHGVDHADFVFIDHWKELYVRDFKTLRAKNFLRPGAIVVADNLVTPGCPEYIKLMQDSPEEFEFELHDTELEYRSHIKDAVGITRILR